MLCRRVMRALSLGLGLDADRLQKALGGDDEGVCIRVNFYPRCPRPDLALGLSPHSDPGGMTVLLADDHVHGLQVCKDGVWITVHPLPNAFIINVGDQIQVTSPSSSLLSSSCCLLRQPWQKPVLGFLRYHKRIHLKTIMQLQSPKHKPLSSAALCSARETLRTTRADAFRFIRSMLSWPMTPNQTIWTTAHSASPITDM